MRPFQYILPLCLALFPTIPALAETAAAATEAAPAVAPVAPAITVSTVGKRVLRDRVIASGLIAAIENVQVAPLIEGQPIEALLADVGDLVEAGQILAVLSKTTLELQKSQFNASLASARATVAQAEAQMLEARSTAEEAQRVSQRTSALRQQGTASQAAADTAQSNAISATARVTVAVQSLEAARAQIALVEAQMANIDLQLSRTEVKAPVSGEITTRNARVGAIASAAGEPMFTIIRDNALEVLADVADEYSHGVLHVTTRQDFQLHYIHIDDTPELMRRLASVGITTREACGNSVRNVTACPLAGVCEGEAFDVTPYAKALSRFLLGHPDCQDFGRKFKIAFSGCTDEACGLVKMHDFGAVARIRIENGTERRGFTLAEDWVLSRNRQSCSMSFCPKRNCSPLPRRSAVCFPGWEKRETGLEHVSSSLLKNSESRNSGNWFWRNEKFFPRIYYGLPTSRNFPHGEKSH